MAKNAKEEPNEEEDGDVFTVEVILAAKVVVEVSSSDEETTPPSTSKKRKRAQEPKEESEEMQWHYRVKWAGYDESEATWEPERNLGEGCNQLLGRFWQAVGLDDDDYPVGAEVRPPKSWIKAEKTRFAKDWKRDQGKKGRPSKAPEAEESNDEPIEPKSLTNARAKLVKKKSQAPKTRPIKGDSESDDDSEPLAARKRRKSEDVPPDRKKSKLSEKKAKTTKKSTVPPKSETKGHSLSVQSVPSGSRATKGKNRQIVSESESESESETEPASRQKNNMFSLFDSPPGSPVTSSMLVASAPISAPAPTPSALTSAAPPPPLPVVPGRQKPQPPPLPVVPLRKPSLPQVVQQAQIPQPEGPGGISTKQRLTQYALAPMLPKQATKPPPSSNVKNASLSRLTTGSTTIMHTNFRKPSLPTLPHRTIPEQTLASLNAPPASPPAARRDPEPPLQESPPGQQEYSDTSGLFDGDTSDFGDTMEVDPVVPTPVMSSADRFLQSIMPPQLAAPYPDPESAAADATSAPPPLPSRRLVPPQPSLKKWSWTGTLCVTCGGEDLRFQITIEDEVELRKTNFRLGLVLGSKKEIKVDSFYDLIDVRPIFRASKPPAYRALVSRQEGDPNADAWTTLLHYMIPMKQVALIPVHLDNNLIGHLLLNPATTSPYPSQTYHHHLSKADSFCVTLLPWSLNNDQIKQEQRLTIEGSTDPIVERQLQKVTTVYSHLKEYHRRRKDMPTPWSTLAKTRPIFQLATRVMGFPKMTYDFLRATHRAYAIVPNPATRTARLDIECQLLKSILLRIRRESTQSDPHQSKGKWIGIKQVKVHERPGAGILFIHVSALRHLDKLSWWQSKILAPDYIRFYVFGSHPSLHPTLWGVREVYPCGGVVTLTPSAIVKYPFEVNEKLKDVAEHPLWQAYIHPVVVGLVGAMRGFKEGDPFEKYPYRFILRAISSGDLAMIDCPPDQKGPIGNADRRLAWVRENLYGESLSEKETLARGQAAFHSLFANVKQDEWERKVDELVSSDLKRMQIQPSMSEAYRRYVVFTLRNVNSVGSVERMIPTKFDFKDGFTRAS